jgi:hypothetical protein
MTSWTFIDRQTQRTQNVFKEDAGFAEVWCPETALGTWIMKQGNMIHVTGNSAYANGWASKVYKDLGGKWRKKTAATQADSGGEKRLAGMFEAPPRVVDLIADWVESTFAAHVLSYVEKSTHPDDADLIDTLRKYTKASKKQKNPVTKKFNVDLTGWKYLNEVSEEAISHVLSYRGVVKVWLDLTNGSRSSTAGAKALWSPGENMISVLLPYPIHYFAEPIRYLESLRTSVRHEVQHLAQYILTEAKRFDGSISEKAFAGLPSRKMWVRENTEFAKGDEHTLLPIEFYTNLADGVDEFLASGESVSEWVRTRRRFSVLKRESQDLWRKAVKEFTKEVRRRDSVRVARGDAKKDVGKGGLDEWFSGHGNDEGDATWGDWVAITPVKKKVKDKTYQPGDIVGPCGISKEEEWADITDDGKDPLKCMPRNKAHDMPKKERADLAKEKQKAEKKDGDRGKKPTLTPTFKD